MSKLFPPVHILSYCQQSFHTFVQMEALKDTREIACQIVVSWIDFANAYESVQHNWIQFAMSSGC